MKIRLLSFVPLFLAIFASRVHKILELPVFVDESLHIMRAQVVYGFSDAVASFLPGKLLTYYYLGFFQPENHNALWLSRVAVALLAPLAAALVVAICQQSRIHPLAMILASLIFLVDSLLQFFGQMALADPFALVFCLGVIWSSQIWVKSFSARWGFITGSFLGLALLAKLTALPFLAVPILVMLFFRPEKRIGPVLLIYVVAGLYLALPMAYVVYQEVAQLENKQEVITTTLFIPQERSRLEQIEYNLSQQWKVLLFGGFFLNILAYLNPLLLRGKTPKAYFFLLGILGLSVGFILFTSAFPSTRYLMISYPLIMILALMFAQDLSRKSLALMFLLLISLGWSLQSPNKALSSLDEWEYFSHTSSGYGLREAAPDILALESEAIPLLSTVGSCHSIRFYFPKNHQVKLHCPYFGFYGNPILLRWEEWQPYAQNLGYVYVLTENKSALEAIETEWIREYPRPSEGESVYLLKTVFRADLAALFPPLETRNNRLPN